MEIVFKLLHQGYDSLTKEEIKDLDTYFGWKIKTTLKGKKLMCIIPAGDAGWFHMVDDLRSVMILYILEKREKLIDLEPDILWKKFNNHAYRYLQYKYWQKSMREVQFQVGDSTQRTKEFSEEELSERYSKLWQIPPQILKLPNDLVKDEKRQHSEITVTTFDKAGKVSKVEKVKKVKSKQEKEEEEFISETKEEKEFFKAEEKSEDDNYNEEE